MHARSRPLAGQAGAARARIAMPSISEVARSMATELRARADASGGEQYWVGIAGGAGSGKTTLAHAVGAALGDAVCIVLPMDGFHFSKAQLERFPDPALAKARRGAPFTFDGAKFVACVAALRAAREGEWPSFDHAIGDPVEGDLRLERRHRIVLVEGSYLLLGEQPWSGARFDETWFVKVSERVARERVATRNAKAWGWPLERALAQADTNDVPNMRVVAACEGRATRVVDGDAMTWG